MYLDDVKALDLYMLGRRLMKLSEDAMRPAGAPPVPTGLRLIMGDLAEHPESSISEITGRTGLPQSHVSQSVARLRERGAVETAGDPRDGRRTLVRLSPMVAERAAQVGPTPVDAALGEALGLTDPGEIAALVGTLEAVLAQLRHTRGVEGAPRRWLDEARRPWRVDPSAASRSASRGATWR
jgi:DNA-binding MarR family transcriptional regulator